MLNSRLRTTLIGLTATAALGVLGGCGSASSTGAAATSSGSATNSSSMSSMGSSAAGSSAPSSAVVIHIAKFAYQTPASVAPGATVTVMNMDGEAHTVTADSGSAFDTKIDPGASSTFTAPMKPGTYAFHCTYHSNMHGMLVVK
jgi:plastocyanin